VTEIKKRKNVVKNVVVENAVNRLSISSLFQDSFAVKIESCPKTRALSFWVSRNEQTQLRG